LSHRRKPVRAKTHIEHVEALIDGWSSDGYRIFEQPKGEGRFVLLAEQLKPLPDELPLVLGDAFQCLRNSLDHIIFAVSKLNAGMTAKDEDTPAFPVTRSGTGVPDANSAIKFLTPTMRQDVRDLAPDSARQQLNEDALWLLNKMSNRDKHREVGVDPIATSSFDSYRLIRSDGTDFFESQGAQRLKPEAGPVQIAEFVRNLGVQADIGHSLQIRFDQGTDVADRPVLPTLWWFHDHIREVVFQRLEVHL
jgi:hypothetical protein